MGNQYITNEYINMSRGAVDRVTVVKKFGKNSAVGTSYEPVTEGGSWKTPQANNATPLRIKAGGSAQDSVTGTGARYITTHGINANGDIVIDTIAANGSSASANTSNSYIRIYRAYVQNSGTYATESQGSHVNNITIEGADGSGDWCILDTANTAFPIGQSLIGCYTIPRGYTGFVPYINIMVETNKTADLLFFKRDNILQVTPPYDAMRGQKVFNGLIDYTEMKLDVPQGPFIGPCDIGFMAKGAATAKVSANFDIILLKDSGPIENYSDY